MKGIALRYLAVIILLVVFVSGAAVFAGAEVSQPADRHSEDSHQTVTLNLKVVNGTGLGTAVEGDRAFIDIYSGDERVEAMESSVDSVGEAVFKDVPGGDDFMALPRVRHDNMMFSGLSVSLEPSDGKVHCSVEVYDVSEDNSVISAGTHHLTLKIVGRSLVVTEFMQLINSTDKAVSSTKDAGKSPKVIDVSLPAGFKDLEFTDYFIESETFVTDEGFYDTMAIPPGSYNASFTYRLDLDGPVMDFQKIITMPTKEFMVFSELGDVKLQGLGEPEGKLNMPDGTEANYYPAVSYNAGDKLVFQLVGIEDVRSFRAMIIIVSAVLVFAVLFVFKWLRGTADRD